MKITLNFVNLKQKSSFGRSLTTFFFIGDKKMITLSNGHKFEYMVASGGLGFFGKGAWRGEYFLRWLGLIDPSLFTIVAKTVTFERRKGNYRWWWPSGCIRFLNWDGDDSRFGFFSCEGVVNAYGLTNPGYEWWENWCWIQSFFQKRISLIASVFSDSERAPQEIYQMVKSLSDWFRTEIVGIEINGSCPNSQGDILTTSRKIIEICEAAKRASKHPLLLKLSVVQNVDEILPRVNGLVEAISINSVPWREIFPDAKSPLARLGGGGISGKSAQDWTWDFVRKLKDKTDIPVIGPSVWDYDDIEKLRKIGADAISFGSVSTKYPWRPTSYVKRDMKERAEMTFP